MPVNLLDTVSGLVNPDLVQKTAGASGESPEGARAGLLGAVPALFAGLAHDASTPSGASHLCGLIERGTTEPQALGEPSLVSNIFGAHADSVTDALSASSGIRRSSAAGILGLVAPLALGALRNEVTSRGLSPGGLAEVLSNHKKSILEHPHLPEGLPEELGFGQATGVEGPIANVPGPGARPRAPERPGDRPLAMERSMVERPVAQLERGHEPAIPAKHHPSRWPILLSALLLGVLAFWGLSNMFRGRPRMPHNTENPTMRQGQGVEERQSPIAAPPESPKEPAPATPPRPEAALSDFSYHFESGTTTMTPGSKKSVDGLASYLHDNPTARIHIEGFADSTGDSHVNEGLSAGRAEALKNALVARGIDDNRVETSGMGSDNPVASNDDDQARAHNRRAEVSLIH